MKFEFDNKGKEDSFLKTRTEFLLLPSHIKQVFLDNGLTTVRSIAFMTQENLEKFLHSFDEKAAVSAALNSLATDIRSEYKIPLILSQSESSEITEPDSDVIANFAQYFGVSRKMIISATRKQEIVRIRDLIVFILKEYAEMSFSAIGRLLGNRDHTTIMHSYNKLKDKFRTDGDLRAGLDKLILRAQAIKKRSMRIESELIPGIIASIQRDCKREKKPEGIITVTERNMKILELYKEGLTLEELGRLFGVTRERARQIAEQTIRRLAHNEAFSKGIELDFDIILQEERKKRGLVKNQKKTIVPKKTKEKTWSRYYLACQSCGTRAIPHRKKGLCQKCTGQYGSKLREGVICRNLNRCGSCSIVRSEAIRLYGRDLYITKNESVLCKKCFLSITGKKLGSRLRK